MSLVLLRRLTHECDWQACHCNLRRRGKSSASTLGTMYVQTLMHLAATAQLPPPGMSAARLVEWLPALIANLDW